MSIPYSYHTFILSFTWKGEKRIQQNLPAFAKVFDKNPYWENQDIGRSLFNAEPLPERFAEKDGFPEACAFYKEYQYFYPHVREALYGFGDGLVRNYCFRPEAVQNRAEYIIRKTVINAGGGPELRIYTLLINQIRLVLFNTGIGLFVMECENHRENQRNPEAVKAINDYGRRINLPFIPPKGEYYRSISADSQTILIPREEGKWEEEEFTADFRAYAEKINTGESLLQNNSVTYISSFIKEILSFGAEPYSFTSDEAKKKNKDSIYIRPTVDDRMFVLCCVADTKVVQKYLARDGSAGIAEVKDREYPFMTDPELQKDLYEMIFIDPEGSCTCRSATMRSALMKKHLYTRWLEAGSIYGLTDQSFIGLFNAPEYYVLETFLIHYNRMAELILAQRASLELFEYEMSQVAVGSMGRKERRIKRKAITRIMSLRQRFIIYQSQLGFMDITSQQQGIEMWGILRESFRIQERTKSLSKRLEALHEAADTDLSYSLNILGVVIALLTGIDILNGLLGGQSASEAVFSGLAKDGRILGLPVHTVYLIAAVLLSLTGILIIMFIFRRRNRQ